MESFDNATAQLLLLFGNDLGDKGAVGAWEDTVNGYSRDEGTNYTEERINKVVDYENTDKNNGRINAEEDVGAAKLLEVLAKGERDYVNATAGASSKKGERNADAEKGTAEHGGN